VEAASSDLRVSFPVPVKPAVENLLSDLDLKDLRVEYEEILELRKDEIDRDPLRPMILFPEGDVEVSIGCVYADLFCM
jgi:hypothetical protein